MKNETICECGHDAFDPPRRHLEQSMEELRDELHAATYLFRFELDGRTWSIELDFFDRSWDVRAVNDDLISQGHESPEAAFAWLKEHLKEAK